MSWQVMRAENGSGFPCNSGHVCVMGWNDFAPAKGRCERPSCGVSRHPSSRKMVSECRRLWMGGKRQSRAAVMLHLRSRYVSKAAIFAVPALPVPVEKSKSRLNSKGLDR